MCVGLFGSCAWVHNRSRVDEGEGYVYMVVGKIGVWVFLFLLFLCLGICIRHFRKEECGGVEVYCRMDRYLPYKALQTCETLFFSMQLSCYILTHGPRSG